ncbi:hypothetical protein CGQ24_07380 [Arthrobacter sp. 7749]|nr:hypothetical protein CGQ24_07380 [Arthrobacter sp. 7749]
MGTKTGIGRKQAIAAEHELQGLLSVLGSDHGHSAGFHVDAQTESSLWAASTYLKWSLGEDESGHDSAPEDHNL